MTAMSDILYVFKSSSSTSCEVSRNHGLLVCESERSSVNPDVRLEYAEEACTFAIRCKTKITTDEVADFISFKSSIDKVSYNEQSHISEYPC